MKSSELCVCSSPCGMILFVATGQEMGMFIMGPRVDEAVRRILVLGGMAYKCFMH